MQAINTTTPIIIPTIIATLLDFSTCPSLFESISGLRRSDASKMPSSDLVPNSYNVNSPEAEKSSVSEKNWDEVKECDLVNDIDSVNDCDSVK